MPRYYVVRRTGSLPSCYRWWGFDAEDLSRGPQSTGSRRTKTEMTRDLVDSGAVVITEAQMPALPTYVKMRTTGEITLLPEEEKYLGALRAIAKAEGLTLAQARQKDPHWKRRQGPLRVAAIIPGSGGTIAFYPRGMVTTHAVGGVL